MRQVIVPGTRLPSAASPTPSDVGELIATVHVAAARGDATALQTVELPDKHLIEVELENGLVLWRRLDSLEGELSVGRSARDDGTIVLPTVLQYGPPGRSATGFMVRLFRFFGTKSVGETAARKAAEKIEDQLVAPGVLLHCPTLADPKPVAHEIPGETDILVLLHGTASSTLGSFGDLNPDATADDGAAILRTRWDDLRRRFTGPDGVVHIYALEHRTLTESPVRNAIQLLENEKFPENAWLHLLSHSRGGLVGEVLARGGRTDDEDAFDKTDLRLLELARREAKPAALDAEREEIARLNALMREKQPEIRTFVRVACPARGTILASKRLDLYLSIIANLIRIIPGPHRGFFEVFRAFVRAVVATRTNASVFPGLEAMMPEGPLVAMLNRPDVSVSAPLMVVGGDVEPAGILRAIATLATDVFFREDHDVVVNTAAMLGGAPREAEALAQLFLDRGGDVTHFSYFANDRTAAQIVGTLTGEGAPGKVLPLQPERELDDTLYARGERGVIDGERPILFLLPGVMGSHLSKAGRRVWMNPIELALGGLEDIGCDRQGRLAGGVASSGALGIYYHDLARDLARQHDVEVFHYDWRRSVTEEADRLAETIRRALKVTEDSRMPIRIVGHSMGGLVARSFVARHRDLWDEMISERRGSRLVMLGTPNNGSAAMQAGLVGRDQTIRKLASFDFRHSLTDVIASVMPMRGLLELLPTGSGFAQYQVKTWTGLKKVAPRGWAAPKQAWLDAAKATHEELRASLERHPHDTEHMFYVAGGADATITALDVEDGKLRLFATRQGDGRVTWRSGHLPGLRTWFAPKTEHGDLARDPSLFAAISDIVAHGDTQRLSELPRERADGAERVFEIGEAPTLYPAPDELQLLAMGGKPEVLSQAAQAAASEVRVRVRHGDLRYEAQTITVGHYENAPLVSAERALDVALDGRLARHRELGLYPGALKTANVFFRDRPDIGPEAALVVGLGTFGQISREALTATMAQAMLRFALRWREQPHVTADDPCRLTTLLIGQRDGRLTIADSVHAILDALANCNERLAPNERIRTLTLLELFEDKAVEALEALRDLDAQNELPEQVVIDEHLDIGRAGRRRHGRGAPDDWEHKIAIAADKENAARLSFESLHNAAVAERHDIVIDRDRIDQHLTRGTASPTEDDELGRLLFSWLVPRQMRQTISDGRNLTLVLDSAAAAYPWELIEDNWIATKEPVGVRANVMRQLRDAVYPNPPLISTSQRVLIVGDPDSDFTPLPGAEREARDVAELFRRHGWAEGDLHCMTRETGETIAPQFTLYENQILHFAGHGVREHGEDRITGLVLGPGKDFFRPTDVQNLDRIPEFVFLNCCHVGAVGAGDDPALRRDRVGLAASLAVEFIRCGTAAVIAAGWEIDDGAAATFSARFYEQFLGGAPFGEAVRVARHATWKDHEGKNTWGAYQCYGDPQFRLRRGVAGMRPRARRRSFAAPSQAIVALEGLTFEACSVRTVSDLRAVSNEFEEILKSLSGVPDWRGDASLLEALGRAAAELGDFPRAIGFFEQAAGRVPARYSASMLGELFELRVRVADETSREAVIREMIDHLTSLTDLPGLGASALTRTRIGDCYLRLAAHLSGDKKQRTKYVDVLREAVAVYGDHAARVGEGNHVLAAHARMREVFATYLLALEGKAPEGAEMDDHIRSVLALIADIDIEAGTAEDSFDNRRLLAEAALFRIIVEELDATARGSDDSPTASDRESLLAAFNAAFLSGSSVRGRRETVDDLKTTATLLTGHRPTAAAIIAAIADDLDVYPSLITE